MWKTFKYIVFDYIVPRLIIDIVFFYAVLLFLGWMAARIPIDAKFVVGAVANYLMLVFAFVINDIADKDDDAKSEFKRLGLKDTFHLVSGTDGEVETNGNVSYKRFRNPFAYNIASTWSGYIVLAGIAIVSIVLSASIGSIAAVGFAVSNLVVGIMYSVNPFRLKSRFPFDTFSHAYLLAAVIILLFLSYPGASIDVWSVMLLGLAFTNSFAGDLRNEYRDFEEDQSSGITNTATLLGKKRTLLISMFLYVLSIILFVVGIVGALLTRVKL